MKTKTLFILSLLALSFIIVISCSKKDDSSNGNVSENMLFPTGQPNNNFATGGSNHIFTGNGGTPVTGGDCAVGTWYQPKSEWSTCPQDYHLKLTFNNGGTGEAWHLDEYLCFNDMHKYFTWKQERDSLFIEYDDETESATPFVCPATVMNIFWNGNNPKLLIRQ